MGQDAKLEHRLTAIMATDVVGYSKLMQSDEAGALAALAGIKEATQNQIVQHRGRIANTAGDSVLAEFGSAVEAVSCAIALQQELSRGPQGEGLQVRIGIHLGDVVDKAGDLLGSAVNIAARLEGIAQAGGIVVSAAVRDAIAGKLPASFTDLGLKPLKNIEEPVRAFALAPRTVSLSPGAFHTGESLPLPSKPSIAVLPFDNLSGDRDQEYFADGVVEEIITALSHFRGLFVIARNSSFTYKGRAVDVKQVGRELGVRYVLEGSVRKAGNRVRITGQLIDAFSGVHLWADRFDGALEDIFDLQDQVTTRVVGAIAPKIEQAEIERIRLKSTDSLDAYDHFLRGMAGFHKWSRDGNDEALAHFYDAIQLDPNYAAAYGMAARVYTQRNSGGWMADRAYEIAETERLANKAADLGRDDAVALSTAGFALSDVVGQVEEGDALVERALGLNPNLSWPWLYSCWIKTSLGEPEAALERIAHAIRLSPNDPQTFSFLAATAMAQLFAGRFEEAYASAEAAIRQRPGFLLYLCIAAASAALAGRPSQAQKAVKLMLQLKPRLRVSDVATLIPILRSEDAARWEEGLRLAGLPE
jgi:TolB-like protein/class 3 adenylate cyclase